MWVLVSGAIHEVFGVDLLDPTVRRATSWRWFKAKVTYLLHGDNPLARHFAPKPEPPESEAIFDGS